MQLRSASRYAGVMSGTSLDGVDAVVADFAPGHGRVCATLGAAHLDFPPALHDELQALQAPGQDEVARVARASLALADLYADAILAACADANMVPADLVAAGVHGQTIRHRPGDGWTVQINDPARVVERTGVTVVADFRRRDVAAGGHGAPLVPAFHHALFSRAGRHRVVVNLGGIANITELTPEGRTRGYDTGPGNVLLDLWHSRHRGGRYDEAGQWGSGGRVDDALLAQFASERYFSVAPPKSTGRDLFNAAWLEHALAAARVAVDPLGAEGAGLASGFRRVTPRDVQATLIALTARTIADAIRASGRPVADVLVAGGGAHNRAVIAALARELAPVPVATTDVEGVAVEHVEALAFAWLAKAAVDGAPGNMPAVTGAHGPRVLGAIYPR
ncbi:MAG: anhydro-N-acetylmuramic acid kinase [Proteobacteria bacterium]|nr:anhydro-N-acetylmuramic acid kinase [Pseudomonadota bacterium]